MNDRRAKRMLEGPDSDVSDTEASDLFPCPSGEHLLLGPDDPCTYCPPPEETR